MQRALLSASASVLVALLAWPGRAEDTPAGSSPSVSLGVLGGGHFFAKGTNLGVATAPDATAGARSNGLWGVRATVSLGRWAAVEAEAFGMVTSDRTYDLRATLLGYRLNGLAYLAAGNLRPFFLLGGGAVEVVSTYADGQAGLVRDRDGEVHVGAGLDYRISDHLSARADARVVEMPGKRQWSLSADFEATLGLALTFGAGPRAAAAREDKPEGRGTAAPAAPLAAPAVAAPAPVPVPRPGAAPAPAPAAPAPVTPAVSARAVPPAGEPRPPVAERLARKAPSLKELVGRGREIRFEGASSKLSLVSMPLLGQIAEALVNEPGVELEIVGHTAASGDARKDQTLSRRRAEAVRRALVEREVDGGRLTATGRGSEMPLAPNVTRSGRQLNERIELRILGSGNRF
jgi:outer membrane protein OmpA-like peptidoglycan-associated protein